jgi:redox-sensitive bicupin YhaK (pirin superfamily)
MQFGCLRVINEDFIEGGGGFPAHGHRDMEIITYLISGAIEHKDSTGTSGVITPFEVQKMTAGRGIKHSEFNHFKDQSAHLLQIWIVPSQTELEPSYEQKNFKDQILSQKLTLLASQTGEQNSLKVFQDLSLWAKQSVNLEIFKQALLPRKCYWLQVVKGQLLFPSQQVLVAGDALSLTDESLLTFTSMGESEVLLFEMNDIK